MNWSAKIDRLKWLIECHKQCGHLESVADLIYEVHLAEDAQAREVERLRMAKARKDAKRQEKRKVRQITQALEKAAKRRAVRQREIADVFKDQTRRAVGRR